MAARVPSKVSEKCTLAETERGVAVVAKTSATAKTNVTRNARRGGEKGRRKKFPAREEEEEEEGATKSGVVIFFYVWSFNKTFCFDSFSLYWGKFVKRRERKTREKREREKKKKWKSRTSPSPL